MGNETSQNNDDSIKDLQKQILENQLKIQKIQLNKLQNSQSSQSSQSSQNNNATIDLKKILSNQELQRKISQNPELKRQLLTKIINEYGNELTSQQINKINKLLSNNNNNNNSNNTNYNNYNGDIIKQIIIIY